MSLPSLNPEKTASGIIVDPSTLERVIPQSKRKDGTVRKEQKVRPGFTPQEDVGRFRSTRQAQEDARSSSRPTIPGSNKPKSQSASNSENNPFASELREKTKAQLKNEKRREKKREKVSVNWDEDDDDEDGEGELDQAFKDVDQQRNNSVAGEGKGAEQSFPPFEGSGGVPNESIIDELKDKPESVGKTAAIEPTPPVAATPPTPESSSTPPPSSTNKKPSILNDRKDELSSSSQPHPIQGGRKGPLGLAHPPPIEEPKPSPPSRADGNDWRTVKKPQGNRKNNNNDSKPSGQQGKSNGKPNQNKGNKQQNQQRSKPEDKPAPASPAPRERKEVKVRQGGANDISSLASRVRNLVVANTVGNTPKEKKETPTPAA
ncbi:uncharacterized protein IL334_005207 [Kwoniella shivajii]|uniref:WIBG Mago-binding domain-containing protein n=1 Tax=Kwoniella shivajii TaxID=564305 RepID=A0ABZ1D2H9_9TREE|nr:hypothetical protein IL334_005207 [Kwoniella shivajii]